LPKSTRINK